MPQTRLILDYVLDHAEQHPDRVYLTQPLGGGQVVDYTWGQVLDQARRMAAHLRGRGLAPGARVAMLSKNCAHFIMAELAIWMAGGTTVAIFPTESAENVRFVLDHSESSLLFVGKLDTWAQQSVGVPASLPCIALPLAPPTGFETWDAIVARTEPVAGRPSRGPDDLAMLLYTSGSTGQPKGVMQSFGRITRTTELRVADTRERFPDDLERRSLSYLPLAHSLRARGRRVRPPAGGPRPRVLLRLAGDVHRGPQARPPDQLRVGAAAVAQVPAGGVRGHAARATRPDAGRPRHRQGSRAQGARRPGTRPRARGRQRVGAGPPGAAGLVSPAGPEPARRLRHDRGLRVFAPDHRRQQRTRLRRPAGARRRGAHQRRGRDPVRSPGQLVGYYKRPDLDRESFTEDGFFRTGDLGERREDGQLRITGRVKELFKTAKGKYVAPAPIENQLNAHPMVELSLVSGVGQPAPYAVLVLDEHLRPRLGDPTVRARVQADLARLLEEVNRGLAAHERLQMLVVAADPWSIENGCLTPTMKIKRSRIEAAVAPQVERWYAEPKKVLWA